MSQPQLLTLVAVGAGGCLGSMLRYLICTALARPDPHSVPVGTLVVNVTGCLIIGAAAAMMEQRELLSEHARGFAVVGLLGGLTTFSAFGNETFALLRAGAYLPAFLSVTAQLVLGVGAVFLGHAVATTRMS